jgi:hypothetical protein
MPLRPYFLAPRLLWSSNSGQPDFIQIRRSEGAADVSKQIVIATQSAPLLNEFDPEDVIVVERHQGESTFRRLNSADLSEWLGEYALGELWQKNVLGGRPEAENTPQLVPDVVGRS